MSYEVIHDGKDRASWLAARKQGIGGSDAPVVLGLSPWRSPLDLYVEKISDTVDDAGSEATHWGNLLEPLILRRFSEITGIEARRDGRLVRSASRDWQLATLDGITDEPSSVECKATSLEQNWEAGPPPYVIAQKQHQLAVFGFSHGYIAALFNGKAFAQWRVERDEDFIAKLIEAEEAFWWRVVTRDPPPAESGDESAIARLFPKVVEAQPVELDEKFAAIDYELQQLKQDKKAINNKIDYYENQLRMAIGEHAGGRLTSGVTYTLKESTRAEYVVPTSTFRTLRRVKSK